MLVALVVESDPQDAARLRSCWLPRTSKPCLWFGEEAARLLDDPNLPTMSRSCRGRIRPSALQLLNRCKHAGAAPVVIISEALDASLLRGVCNGR